MKKTLQLLLTGTFCLSCARGNVSAQEFVHDGLNYSVESLDDKTASVAKNPVANGDITIPATVIFENNGTAENLKVVSIGESAFDSNQLITSVRMPDSVTEIGNNAFDNCNNLTAVEFGNSVISIGDYAFRYCTALSEIELPATVETVGKFVFGYCDNLERAYLGEKLSVISYAMFANNYKLEHVDIPASVTEIAISAFSDCQALQELVLPDGLKSIKVSAIYRCKALKELIIPASVTSIGMSNFWYCENLTKVMSLTEQPLALDNGNFSHSPITTLVVPEGLKDAYADADVWNRFQNIVEIKRPEQCVGGIAYTRPEGDEVSVAYISSAAGDDVVIPVSVAVGDQTCQVTEIGRNAAVMNDGIRTLSIGSGAASDDKLEIGDMAFANCEDIAGIVSAYVIPPVASENVFASDVYANASLEVPAPLDYLDAEGCWPLFKSLKNNGVIEVFADKADKYEIYTLSGVRVAGANLAEGIYLRRSPVGVSKIIVR